MTNELLLKAKIAQKNIEDIESTLYAIKRIKLIDEEQKERRKPSLRFVNALKQKDGKEVREATTILFDGISMHGTDIPTDDSLLDCIKDYFERKLEEAKTEFEAL